MFAAGGEREKACVSCQDPWDENNFEMRSYNVYSIIQHVTSSLVVTTRHQKYFLFIIKDDGGYPI